MFGGYQAVAMIQPPAAPAAVLPATATGPAADRAAFIQTYCSTCHSATAKLGGLTLVGVPTDQLSAHPEIWEKVAERLDRGEMPPKTAPRRPDAAAAHAMASQILAELDAAAAKSPYAGRSVIRRLNRTEYSNAVSDLLNIDFPYASSLPRDTGSGGFDNVADALSVSPLLLESYLKVARRTADLALGRGDASLSSDTYPATKSQTAWMGEGMPFNSRGGVLIKKYFPRDAEYDLRAFLSPGELTAVEGVRFFHFRTPVTTGEHTLAVTFMQSQADREGPVPQVAGNGGPALGGPVDPIGSTVQPRILFILDGKVIKQFNIKGPTASEATAGADAGPPVLLRAEVNGPYNPGPPANTASRKQILACTPKGAADEEACAQKDLAPILRRAWRRDVTAAELKPFLTSFKEARAAGEPFEGALSSAIREILISPGFLFRVEFDPQNAKPGQVYKVSDFDLASRLSFFLWSSIPDDQLLAAASKNQLHQPAVLDAQVRRMLQDKRSDSLIDNFAAQWLGIRGGGHPLEGFSPDPAVYPSFDPALTDDFRTEMQLFLTYMMRENRPMTDIINANYTYVNQRLADNYGIAGVKGPGFRRVVLPPDSPRGGVLGMGAILMPNSHPGSTSPVYRGEWILTALLDSPPKPPPPGVPPLSDTKSDKPLTVRAQLEMHRASAICSSCHSVMDPYGFSLENFDVTGKWREADAGGKIDPTSQMANGATLSGPQGLRKVLNDEPERYVGAVTSRMMTFALGRSLDPRDRPAVRQIVEKTKPNGYRFADMIAAVVQSPEFQMRQVEVQK